MTVFFYDSYAIIEYLNNNSRFISYFEQHRGILTLLNILEVYYSVLWEGDTQRADLVLETLLPLAIEPRKETIQRAMKFRYEHKKKNLSYADCLGYQIALDQGIKFLTGDKEFEHVKNVEFVK